MKEKLTSIQVSISYRDKLKNYCDKKGYNMNKFVEALIEKNIMETNQTTNKSTYGFKNQNKFICKCIDSTGEFIPTYAIKSITRPSFNERNGMDIKWESICLTLFDLDNPNTIQSIYSHITRNEKFKINTSMLDQFGNEIEKWEINDAFISAANFDNLDWTNSEILKITLSVSYTNPILVVKN